MRYWKVIYFTSRGTEEYAVTEKIIDEPMFRKFQQAYAEDREDIVLDDRIIKRKMIKEICPANDEVREHKKTGMFKHLGLPDVPVLEDKKSGGFLPIKKFLSNKSRTETQEEVAKEERS